MMTANRQTTAMRSSVIPIGSRVAERAIAYTAVETILGPGLVAGTLALLFMISDYQLNRSHSSLKRNWFAGAFLAITVGVSWVASLGRG